MAENNTDSTVAEGATTPAPAEIVETSNESQPDPLADPWDFGKDEQPEQSEEKPEEAPEKTEPPKKEETDEKPLEDQLLEEAFSDEKTDDDPDKADPKEMIAGQRNAASKAWAERAERVYTPIKDFKYGKIEPKELQEKLAAFIGDDKAGEFSQFAAHSLVDTNPDATFQRAYAVKMLQKDPNWDLANAKIPTLDEVIGGAKTETQKEPTATPSELSALTAELDKVVEWDWRDPNLDENFVDEREKTMAQTIRALEAKANSETSTKSDLEQKVEKLEKSLEGIQTGNQSTYQKTVKTELDKTVADFRSSIEQKILPFIAKSTGLEVLKNDTPEIATFKQNRMLLYTGTEYEKANGLPSQFESFAYNESSVKNELEVLTDRLVNAQVREVDARLKGNAQDSDKYRRLAEDEKVPLMQLLAQANKEFKQKYIQPDLDLIGKLSTQLTAPLKEASERVEVVSNGAGISTARPKPSEARTADDVWAEMVTESETDERLRASA